MMMSLSMTLSPSWRHKTIGALPASALLCGDPCDFNSVDEPNTLAEYLRDYY